MAETSEPRKCGDCAVSAGQLHSDGCDVARCLMAGGQRLSCPEDHDHGRDVWTGTWPGELEREPPPDGVWMETEEIGVGYGFLAWCGLAAVLVIALVVTLSLVLS
jgi:hypothetical protein